MSPAFTPGPWVACGNDRGGCSCGQVWSRAVDQPVAKANTIWGDDLEHPYGEIPFDEMVANARLIAAAPELLGALKGAMAAINAAIQLGMAEAQGHERTAAKLDAQIEAARAQARAAIAKATGVDQ